VPKTRVATPDESKRPAARTAAQPAAPAKRGLPMPAVVAAAVVILGGGSWYVATQVTGNKASPENATSPTTASPPSAQPDSTAAPKNDAGGTNTQPQNTAKNGSGGSAPPRVVPNPGTMTSATRGGSGTPSGAGRASPSGGALDPAAAFDNDRAAWAEWTDPLTDATAQRVIDDVNAKLSKYSGENRADALYYRGLAYLQLERTESGCGDMREALRLATRDIQKDKISAVLRACPAPK
jgi:hypothetical protein